MCHLFGHFCPKLRAIDDEALMRAGGDGIRAIVGVHRKLQSAAFDFIQSDLHRDCEARRCRSSVAEIYARA